jgi:hypothetical protein
MGGGLGALCSLIQARFCVGPLALLAVPWSTEAPVKGGTRKVVSLGIVSSSDGAGGAPRVSKGLALFGPLEVGLRPRY